MLWSFEKLVNKISPLHLVVVQKDLRKLVSEAMCFFHYFCKNGRTIGDGVAISWQGIASGRRSFE